MNAPARQDDNQASPAWRLDHVNVVVRDLAAARAQYQRLGFAFKHGRPHANSILNEHMKFPDSTELELITATEPRDDLARRYLALLDIGEGGAHIAMRPDSGVAITENIPEVFTSPFLRSPTDSAHHFEHPNGAYRLLAAWIALDSADHEFDIFGLRPIPAFAAPLGRDGTRAVRFAGGGVLYALPRRAGDPRVTRILGVTIAVRSLAVAAALVQSHGLPLVIRESPRGRSLLIPPLLAHGIWIELIEA